MCCLFRVYAYMREFTGVLKSGWIEIGFQVFRKEVLRLWKHSVRWCYHVCMGHCLWVGTLIMPSASAKTGMFKCTIDLAFWLEEAGWNGHEHEYEVLFTLLF